MNFDDAKGLAFAGRMNAPGHGMMTPGAQFGAPRQAQYNKQKEYSFLDTLDPKNQPKGYAPGYKKGEERLGTSIMAVAFNGGVVIGADSRTSTGSYVANRVSDKLTQVTDFVYCLRSGSAADTQAISEIAKYYLSIHAVESDDDVKVATAAHIFRDLCYHNKDRLMAGIIVGGWDSAKGGQVYSIPLGGSVVEQPFAIGGSGSTYIYGYCDDHFKPGMSKTECEDFVKRALAHAMTRDGSSGGVIRMVTITKDGPVRSFVDHNDLPVRQ